MADKLRVTTQMLHSDAESIKKDIESIKTAVVRMQDEITQLHSMWTGPAHEAFKANLNGDMAGALALVKELETFTSDLDTASDTYKLCSEKVDSYIDSIKL